MKKPRLVGAFSCLCGERGIPPDLFRISETRASVDSQAAPSVLVGVFVLDFV